MKKILIALLVGLMLFTLACSNEPAATDAVLKIDDMVVDRTEFNRNLALVKYNYMAQYGPTYFDNAGPEIMDPIHQSLLDEMVIENLIIRDAGEKGITNDTAEMDDYFKRYMESTFGTTETPTEAGQKIRTYLDENDIDDAFLRRLLERDQLVRKYVINIQESIEGDEARMKELNETAIAQVKGAHILVDDKAKADELYAIIKEDPSQFAELAKANSKDGSAENGGELGYYTRGEMVVPFNDASFTAEVGVVTEPVESEYGYHLILISEKRTIAQMEQADETPEMIDLAKRNLVQDLVRQEYYARVDALKENSTIERFPIE